MDLIKKNSFTPEQLLELEQFGRDRYKNIPIYQALANILEHPESRTFVEKYLSNATSIQTVLLMIKTYQQIESISRSLTPYQKIAILSKSMEDANTRHLIHQKYIDWNTPVIKKIKNIDASNIIDN